MMKIKTIEFQNFRNFKERSCIHCSTDGKVTIIYGNNGDGKTTLHQLFQWAFYNRVRFNRTTSDKMYNLEFESEQEYDTTFSVWVTILFEHAGNEYFLRREWVYKKQIDTRKISEDFSISMKDSDYNWNRLNDPTKIIELLLPSGLSEYFFFDGESMIADLRVKGQDSATKLKQALYTILDLNLLENAASHIGSIDLKTTALGRLFLSKASSGDDQQVATLKRLIESIQVKIASSEERLTQYEAERAKKMAFIQDASERIGGTKSKQQYEFQRKQYKALRDSYLDSGRKELAALGDDIIRDFPRLLLSKAASFPRHQVNIQTRKDVMIRGTTKTLINSLLKSGVCVCGRPLSDTEYDYLNSFLQILPPYSYETLYGQFMQSVRDWQKGYVDKRARLGNHIAEFLALKDKAEQQDIAIQKLDNDEKGSDSSLQELIDDRRRAEIRLNELEDSIKDTTSEIRQYQNLQKGKMKVFDEATSNLTANKRVDEQIKILQQAKAIFEERLQQAAITYSQNLRQEIQDLLDRMLTSKRTVRVSSDFLVRVFDSYDDESKSEGQFAIVSFAYIGGILKLLKSEEALQSKEYPLVLDGPFSKLGADHRKNVIDSIPEYAPQIIIFSKDNLQGDFAPDQIGRVWTIRSNDEKNVASVKEGFLW